MRVDLFDTEIDSLRYFDASTQRSIKNVEEVEILPATDFILPVNEFKRVEEKLAEQYEQLKRQVDGEDELEQLANRFEPLLTDLKQHQLTNEFLTYTNLIYPQEHSLLDYLSA